MLNNVVLIGRLTRDPEIRYTQSNRGVCSFNLAVNRNFTAQSGEREADFINITAWGKTAENVSKYVKKGSLVAVEGRIQTRTYDTPQGEKRYVTEVVANTVTFLESRGTSDSRPSSNDFFNQQDFQSSATKPASFDSDKDPFAEFGNSIDISDDDLPF